VVIIGGGFAGMNLAKRLDRKKFSIKVIDRNNYHSFPPLFYQIASSALDVPSISFPFRREFKKTKGDVAYHMGHVKNIDVASKTVTTSYETLKYDKLVIAAGSTNNFFGMEGLEENVFCIKTSGEASHTRDEILDRLERGCIEKDPERRKQLLSFLVIGGGPAGVEIAGALGEMKRDVLPREYPELDPEDMTITLVEGADRLLSAFDAKLSQKAYVYLTQLLVDIRLNTVLKGYKDKMVAFADGHQEYWETLIWTAGVKGEVMPGLPQEMVGRGGRIMVDEYNQVKGHDDLFALGDIAMMQTDEYPNGHPQLAQPAIQQAKNLAFNLNKGDMKRPFRYKDKGTMATVGRNKAIAQIGKMTFSGFFAWVLWMAIHLISILGVRTKVTVLLNWIWNYCTYSTSLRLLMRPVKFPLRRHWGD
ncbi:MAG: NAD(P)/FAD-dependent oxidoreductase, partial [Muribaculaceae bacterium]|nr:NAD(P)/FAD-dependent oxidoreductase [Muribaculaceae bacterium]